MNTIRLRVSTFHGLPAGSVVYPVLDDARLPSALRSRPPRCKLLSDVCAFNQEFVECEILDEWPDAPEQWPLPGYGKGS